MYDGRGRRKLPWAQTQPCVAGVQIVAGDSWRQ